MVIKPAPEQTEAKKLTDATSFNSWRTSVLHKYELTVQEWMDRVLVIPHCRASRFNTGNRRFRQNLSASFLAGLSSAG